MAQEACHACHLHYATRLNSGVSHHMKYVAIAALLSLCDCAAVPSMQFDHAPLPADSDASRHFIGNVDLVGTYYVNESGEICFLPNSRSLIALPVDPGNLGICFSN